MGNLISQLIQKRQETGETQEQFAARIGIAQQMWSFVESGQRGLGTETLAKILNVWPDMEVDVLNYIREHRGNGD